MADSSSVPPRVNGMLWAGTTFELRAAASIENQPVAVSSAAQVRVGQVIRWESQLETAPGMSLPPGVGRAEFRVRVWNRGNSWDNLSFALQQYETTESLTWSTALLEMGSDGRLATIQGTGSLIEPGRDAAYIVRMDLRSLPTDGAWATLQASVRGATAHETLGAFIAGAVRPEWVRLRAWCYGNQTQFVSPVLYQGRLFWMGTNPNTNETHLFYTRDAVEATQNNMPLGNERRVYGRVLRAFVPAGFSLVLGNGWFTGLGSQLIRIDLPRVLADDRSSDPYTVVAFPGGVQPRLDLEPLVFAGRLYVAGSDRRLHVVLADGTRAGQSAPMPASYGAFSSNLVQIGRILYIGTDAGWVVQFDALTGNLRTARRIASQRVHSLAVAPFGRVLLARVGNREVFALNPAQLNPVWRRALNEEMVSPVVSSPEYEVAVVVSRSGTLHAFHTRTGALLPHYPQRIFGDNATLARASVALVRRADRRPAHLYVLAQQDTGSDTTQPLFRIVTLENPYNRLEFDSNTLHEGADYLPQVLFTGNQNTSYCLIASRRATQHTASIAAIPLR